MAKYARVKSYVPWLVEEGDVNPAESGVFSRDLQVDGQGQRHFGLPVLGQFDASLSLGMLAIRCERKGTVMVPLAVACVDAPPLDARTPLMDLRLLSGQNRAARLEPDDATAHESDGD